MPPEQAPPTIDGVTWLRLHCAACDGDRWIGLAEGMGFGREQLLDPLSATGLTLAGEALVAEYMAAAVVCADCSGLRESGEAPR